MVAHGLKSSALHMGATALSQKMAAIERKLSVTSEALAPDESRRPSRTSRPSSPRFGPTREADRGAPGASGLHDPHLDAPAHEAGDLRDVDLVHDVCAVLLDRADAQIQPVGDLLRRNPSATRRATSTRAPKASGPR